MTELILIEIFYSNDFVTITVIVPLISFNWALAIIVSNHFAYACKFLNHFALYKDFRIQ